MKHENICEKINIERKMQIFLIATITSLFSLNIKKLRLSSDKFTPNCWYLHDKTKMLKDVSNTCYFYLEDERTFHKQLSEEMETVSNKLWRLLIKFMKNYTNLQQLERIVSHWKLIWKSIWPNFRCSLEMNMHLLVNSYKFCQSNVGIR